MATKKVSAMTPATSVANADLIPIVQGGENKSASDGLINFHANHYLNKIRALGSAALATTFDPYFCSAGQTLIDGRQYMIPIFLQKDATLTGVKFQQVTQGNYTADNNNRIGLYSVVAGVLTLVASRANNGDLWKGAAGAITVPFSAPYAAAAGVYYIGYLYNNSAQVTAPVLAGHPTLQASVAPLDLANSNILSSYFASTDLVASTTAMSTALPAAGSAFFMLY